jgi:hypothetical protein
MIVPFFQFRRLARSRIFCGEAGRGAAKITGETMQSALKRIKRALWRNRCVRSPLPPWRQRLAILTANAAINNCAAPAVPCASLTDSVPLPVYKRICRNACARSLLPERRRCRTCTSPQARHAAEPPVLQRCSAGWTKCRRRSFKALHTCACIAQALYCIL